MPEPEDVLLRQQTSEIPVVSASDGRRPAPFVLDFSWRPGYSDYPVALIQSTASMRRRATLGDPAWADEFAIDPDVPDRTPARYIPHALAVAAIVAVIMSNGFWLNRSDSTPSDSSADTPAGIVADVPSEEEDEGTESLLNRTQQPGQGGNVADPTSATESTGSGTVATQEETDETTSDAADAGTGSMAEPAATATVQPMVPNPAVPFATASVQIPEAGATEYVTSKGETLLDVASSYGLAVTSLLWPNDVSDPSEGLETGTELMIPPVDGVLHTVRTSDTIERIAVRYGVGIEAIIGFEPNGIGGSPDLRVGQLVMVPGGMVTDWGKIQEYTVREGDNLWLISSYYGLHPQTLAWANILPRPELISPGQVLEIPPGDGALITVEAGDHVEAIAERFGVEANAIREFAFNNLSGDRVLQVGQYVLVPGAPLPELDRDGPTVLDADSVAGEGAFNPATGTFIWPTNGFISQEFHGHHNGLDVANKEWTPVNAADGGIVIFAGWNDYGLGYAVGVDHGNGYQTWYGHLLNQPYVEVGQVVWQGGYLGPMGSTGNSTGPHLHFVVMKDGVYQDPLAYLSR